MAAPVAACAAVIAPPISGILIGHALGDVYIGLLVVGSLVCGLVAIARLEPRLDPRVNGVREDETAADGELDATGGALPTPLVEGGRSAPVSKPRGVRASTSTTIRTTMTTSAASPCFQ